MTIFLLKKKENFRQKIAQKTGSKGRDVREKVSELSIQKHLIVFRWRVEEEEEKSQLRWLSEEHDG